MGFSSSIGRTLQQPIPMGQAFAYDKFGNQVPQSSNLFDMRITPIPALPEGPEGPSSGKGGGYSRPTMPPIPQGAYIDNSYASFGPTPVQSPYGYSSRSNVGQQYSPMFSSYQSPQPNFVTQQLPSGATTYAPTYASTYGSRPRPYAQPPSYNQFAQQNVTRIEPEFQARPKNIFNYPSQMQDTFAGNEQYQALIDYQKSLEPTEEQKARLQELRSAFEGSDAYRDFQQKRQDRMMGGIGGYRGMYGPQINREFGGFRPYMMPQYGYGYY